MTLPPNLGTRMVPCWKSTQGGPGSLVHGAGRGPHEPVISDHASVVIAQVVFEADVVVPGRLGQGGPGLGEVVEGRGQEGVDIVEFVADEESSVAVDLFQVF